jgi:hypothetical protein
MAQTRLLQRAFSGGEISPEMFGRSDDAKYVQGMAVCRNFMVKPQGPIENRPGFAWVNETKNSAKKSRLIPFTFSSTQTMCLEFGEQYIRFHTQGATLMNGNVPYEVVTPYLEADLFDIHYVQSADVLTLVHPNYPPAELRRYGVLDWRYQVIDFTQGMTPPTGVTAVASGHTVAKYTYYYVVTSVNADGTVESAQSAIASADGNLFETGAIVTISWTASANASRYIIYKMQGGVFGYIGETADLSIVDDNIAADLSKSPPIYETPFTGEGNYPAAVSYFEQRRVFAGADNKPQNIWMTKSGTESVFSYSLPTRDDDRISFRVAAREANIIRHIVPLTQLLVLTSSAEWQVQSVNSDALTPSTIGVRPQSYGGASNVQPVVAGSQAIFSADRGGHVMEMGYTWERNGFITGDLCLRAAHLFDGFAIADMAFQKAPYPVIWMPSSNGNLLGLTYLPEQQIGAWHRHDTAGKFESCAVVIEGDTDALYCIINRTINGQQKRFVERMASRRPVVTDQKEAFFVDCGGTYRGNPTTTISGLTWLEGQTVSILADGAVHPQRVVTNGAITLDHAASIVHVGLPIQADMQTMPAIIGLQDGSMGQGRPKAINKLWIRVFRSSGIWAGQKANDLREVKQRKNEPYGTPPALNNEEEELQLPGGWNNDGQIYMRQIDPLPLTVIGIVAEVNIGG